MENPTHSFRETNFVLQFIKDSQIESKTVMTSQKKKKAFSVPVNCLKGNFFNIFVLSQCIVY